MDVDWGRQEVRDDRALISPPWLEPAWQCGPVAVVHGYVPNARIDLEIDGAIAVADFPGGFPNPTGAIIPLPAPLVAGQALRARQKTDSAISALSTPVVAADHKVVFPQGLPRPAIDPAPVHRCGLRTGVGNLLVGCDVWIIADGIEVGRVSGAAAQQGVNVQPAYGADQSVTAFASLCGDVSPPSEAKITQPPPSPLPKLDFEAIYEGSQQLVVINVVNGAVIEVSRNGTAMFTSASFGVRHLITLDKAVITAEKFSAQQRLCPGDPPSPKAGTSVKPCSALPAPDVVPVQAGDTQVTLTGFVPDAVIKVVVNGTKTGEGSGPVVQLTAPIPGGATVLVHQATSTCESPRAQQLTAQCLTPQPGGDPTLANMWPVGFRTYDGGDTPLSTGVPHRIAGTIYYPAVFDGEGQPFNHDAVGISALPIVFMAHGNAPASLQSHLGYDYFQRQLAAMGIVAVSVDCLGTNGPGGGPSNILDRAILIVASIRHWKGTGVLWGPVPAVDFHNIGLMGHSRGGEAVVVVNEIFGQFDQEIGIRAVLSLAPTNAGVSTGIPSGYDFMAIVPAGDGDVVLNNGLQYYDAARPSGFKSQLYLHSANHNYFNRKWPTDDTEGGLVLMFRSDHEHILSAYGCAFFRAALLGHDMLGYLDGSLEPQGVEAGNVHPSFELAGQTTVDDHEQANSIGANSLGRPTAQLDGLTAAEHPFAQKPGAASGSFYGNTTGMVAQSQGEGRFRSGLDQIRDLSRAELWIRAAEVYELRGSPERGTGFALGLEDVNGVIVWVDCDGIGGLPRPYDRRAWDITVKKRDNKDFTKTVPKTLRFPAGCFEGQARDRGFDIRRVIAIWLRLDREDGRRLAFDDLQIVLR